MENWQFLEDYLFELMTFIGMKKLEYLYNLVDWTDNNMLIPFFGTQGCVLKQLLSHSNFVANLCIAYNIKSQTTFLCLIKKYKKRHLFTDKYDTDDRILYYYKYMPSYKALKKAAMIRDYDFISYMLNNKKLKHSHLHMEYMSSGFYDEPELICQYNTLSPLLVSLEDKAFYRACKYWVNISLYNKYMNLFKGLKRGERHRKYVIGKTHFHLFDLHQLDMGNFLDSAIKMDNISLVEYILTRNSNILSQQDIIHRAINYGAMTILKYLEVTRDELLQGNFAAHIKMIKYLFSRDMPEDIKMKIPIIKTLSYKVVAWLYKKYNVIASLDYFEPDEIIEFLYNNELIYDTKICEEILDVTIHNYVVADEIYPEVISILLKIKNDERVKDLFNDNIIAKLQQVYEHLD